METTSHPIPVLLRIGELAKQCDKTVRALHLYEERGLLIPARRTGGGFRLYDESAAQRVKLIGCLQEAGLSLTDIQGFLQAVQAQPIAPETMKQLHALLGVKLQDIRRQQENLARIASDITDALSYLESCKQCEPTRTTRECPTCQLHGHKGTSPFLVAGVHHQPVRAGGES